eukprot:2280103-Rhodomonas_salina.1
MIPRVGVLGAVSVGRAVLRCAWIITARDCHGRVQRSRSESDDGHVGCKVLAAERRMPVTQGRSDSNGS